MTKTSKKWAIAYNIKEILINLDFDTKGIKCNFSDINKDNMVLPCIASVTIDGSNPVTFMIVTHAGIGDNVMKNDFTNAGGWKDSEMRTWLNTTIYESMTDTKPYIKRFLK